MSHFTTIQTEVRDLEALNDACAELGLQPFANALCRGYAGVSRQAQHVLRLKGLTMLPSIREKEADMTSPPAGGTVML